MPASLDAFAEAFGGLSIAAAAAAYTSLAHARSSPTAVVTLLCCATVLLPFVTAAGTVVLCGLCCCVPFALAGCAVAWLPTLVRATGSLMWSAVLGASRRAPKAVQAASEAATGRSKLLAVACACAVLLPLTPLVLVSPRHVSPWSLPCSTDALHNFLFPTHANPPTALNPAHSSHAVPPAVRAHHSGAHILPLRADHPPTQRSCRVGRAPPHDDCV